MLPVVGMACGLISILVLFMNTLSQTSHGTMPLLRVSLTISPKKI